MGVGAMFKHLAHVLLLNVQFRNQPSKEKCDLLCSRQTHNKNVDI